jgi:membrane-associated HD superfamily phosphohydrolase
LLHPFFADVFIGLAVFGLIFALVFTAVSPERYELKAGDIPSEPIAAPRDVEDVKATQERIEQARQQVNDIYTLDHTITAGSDSGNEEIFAGMEQFGMRRKKAAGMGKGSREQHTKGRGAATAAGTAGGAIGAARRPDTVSG